MQQPGTYQTRIADYGGVDRSMGDAALAAFAALYGRVERKLFADVAAGRSAGSLKIDTAFLLPRRNGLGHTQRSQDRVINAVLRNGIIRYVAGLLRVLSTAEPEICELLVQSPSGPVVLSETLIELLDVAHGPTGVAHRSPFDLVGHAGPLRLKQHQFRHDHAGDVLPNRGYAGLQDLSGQVVRPPAGVKPSPYQDLLTAVRINPDPARLLRCSVGVRACDS